MPLPRALARFNRMVTNRVQGLWADRLPPWGVIIHRGRRSGREHRTPVLAWRDGDRLVVALFYGADTDWVRNVLSAGHATVVRAGTHLALTDPHVVPADAADLDGVAHVAGRLAGSVLVGVVAPE